MKLLIADPLSKDAILQIKKTGLEVDDCSDVPKEEIVFKLYGADIIVIRSATKITNSIMDKMGNTKLIIRAGVGLDNIDIDYAKSKGIEVRNIPKVSATSVAELVFGHMLACARHIVKGTISIKENKWEKHALEGTELFGKTLGVIGLGAIGKKVAKIGKAFDMVVIAFSPNKKSKRVTMVDLDTLLKRSDFITVHVPNLPLTRHLLGKKEFDKMKDGVVIINCARGGIVDEGALLQALKRGRVRAAALDVFEKEPPHHNELFDLANVIFTPHIGAETIEAKKRIGLEVVKIVKRFMGKNHF
ncbi:MAG: D-2-hydroxyacid dehydrogenase [Candidatus Omnitrophica bacterium]|nr:D-2-hydroxyacid dehydrogenase [Candidatus Omnitrophota bacterium]